VRRRDFITLVGGVTAGWPLAARAQQPEKMNRIGYLTLLSGPSQSTEGFQRGLSQLGYVEGQNVIILYRWAAGRKDRLVDLAKELLQLKVDLFASQTTEAIMAIRSINETIPIVMTSVSDPIGNKLIASFARPGGNTTGVTLSSTDLATKRLGLLKEVVPNLSRVAVLVERNHPPAATMIKETQAAAGLMRIELQILEVGPEQIRDAFKSMERARPDALIVQQTAPFNAYIKEMADLALDARLPSVHENREYVRAGGLIAYGPDLFASGPITLIEFSRARIRLIFRLSNQPNLYSRSISNLQRRLA
jgi:putative ABC transport system substrate-binding protein